MPERHSTAMSVSVLRLVRDFRDTHDVDIRPTITRPHSVTASLAITPRGNRS